MSIMKQGRALDQYGLRSTMAEQIIVLLKGNKMSKQIIKKQAMKESITRYYGSIPARLHRM
jgi:hypothetical protein